MIARIFQVNSEENNYFIVKVRVLGLFWIDADIYKTGFPSRFNYFEDAVSALDKLKPTKTYKILRYERKF